MTHTPGPWKALEYKGDTLLRGRERSGGTMPVAIIAKHHVTPISIYEANARLIAASPELLAALKGMVTECDEALRDGWVCGEPNDPSSHVPACAKARAAIKKVEGS